MKTSIIILTSILFFMVACSKENNLEQSVFVSDLDNPELPEYSEWGYNTFGAYYDRQAFISNNSFVPAKCIVTDNMLSFVLTGQLGSGYYYSDNNKVSLSFKIPGFLPTNYKQLIQLNDTTLDLMKPGFQVWVTNGTTVDTATVIEGSLQVKRAQNLVVDDKQVEVILSGYFDVKVLIRNEPITISSGRFDVGIGDDNFYVY